MELQKAFDDGFDAVKGYVDRSLISLHKRIDDLESKSLRYCGVWQRGLAYTKGSLVTSDGAGWIAVADVAAAGDKPGNGGPWILAVKGGVAK